jgi:hypothetical protein
MIIKGYPIHRKKVRIACILIILLATLLIIL